MKKLVVILILIGSIITAGRALASDVDDAIYSGTIRATNNSTAASNVCANISMNTPALITASIMASDAKDIAVRGSGGSDTAVMPGNNSTNPWVVYFSSVPNDGSIDATLYTNATSGKICYFPSDTGANVADSVSLEPSGNYTLSFEGGFDTTAEDDKYVFSKGTGFFLRVSPVVTGNVTLTTGTGTDSFTTGDDGETDMYAEHWRGMPFSTTDNTSIYGVSIYGKPQNIVTTANISIRNVSAGIPTGTDLVMKEVNISTWDNTTSSWHDVIFDNDIDITQGNDYAIVLGVKGDSGLFKWRVDTDDGYASSNRSVSSDYGASWAAQAGEDGLFKVFYGNSLSATGVSSTDQTVTISASSSNTTISVDGSVSVTGNTTSVIDSTDNWTFFENCGMLYMESAAFTIGGNAAGEWEWEYTSENFTDLSGNNNDMTPSYRTTSSHASVSAELISFQPVSESVSSNTSDTWPDMVADAPDEPSTTYSENTTPGFFFAGLATEVWGLTGIDDSYFWYNFSFLITLFCSVVVFYLFANKGMEALIIKIITAGGLLIFFALPGLNVFGLYVAIYYMFFAFGILILKKDYGW